MKKTEKLQISLAMMLRFPNSLKLINREIKTVVLNTRNPMNSTKVDFNGFFIFLLDFSKKIYDFF